MSVDFQVFAKCSVHIGTSRWSCGGALTCGHLPLTILERSFNINHNAIPVVLFWKDWSGFSC